MITLAQPASHALEVRRSRFIARASSVESADAALAFIDAQSDPAATHNCWAYRIGASYRSTDDGEPGGTAGRPILQAIDGQGLDHVAVVVTRWYGGIKLGAGGLVRAYGGCAAECLRLAARVERVLHVALELRCLPDDLGIVHALLARHGAHKRGEHYDGREMCLLLDLAEDRSAPFRSALADATRGRAQLSSLPTPGPPA